MSRGRPRHSRGTRPVLKQAALDGLLDGPLADVGAHGGSVPSPAGPHPGDPPARGGSPRLRGIIQPGNATHGGLAMLALAETYAQPAMREAVRRGEGLDDNGNGTGDVVHLWRNGTMSAHHRQLVLGAPRPRAAGGGTDITRMPCSYRQRVTMFTRGAAVAPGPRPRAGDRRGHRRLAWLEAPRRLTPACPSRSSSAASRARRTSS
jgi:hypothetical protein